MNTTTRPTPHQRGRDYIEVMHQLARPGTEHHAHDDELLERLDSICAPYKNMSSDELNQVLAGIHDALQERLATTT